MRILDPEQDRALDEVSIFLTPDEAREMVNDLKQLLEHYEEPGQHSHLSDSEYRREITLSIYTDSNLPHFTERARRLILEGS